MGGQVSKLISNKTITTSTKNTLKFTSLGSYKLKLSINAEFFKLTGSKIIIETDNPKTGYKNNTTLISSVEYSNIKSNDIYLSEKPLSGDTTVNVSIIVPKSNKVYIKDLSIEQILEKKSKFGSSLSSSNNKSFFYLFIFFIIAIILYLKNKK